MVDLNQLKQLITFFEEGTITRASEKLLISQPALTRSLQRLEEDLGVTLFNRQKNKTTFTDTGLFVVDEAMKLLTHAEHFEDVARRYELKNTTLFIGSCAPGPIIDLENLLREKEAPFKTEFSLTMDQDELLSSLLDESHQVIFTTSKIENPNVISKVFMKEQLNVALLPTHPLATKEELTFKDLEHLTMLVLTDLGIWEDVLTLMPNTHFIRQQDAEAFRDLITASALPHFTTNVTQDNYGEDGKVHIPLANKEATKTFYINILKKNHKLIEALA